MRLTTTFHPLNIICVGLRFVSYFEYVNFHDFEQLVACIICLHNRIIRILKYLVPVSNGNIPWKLTNGAENPVAGAQVSLNEYLPQIPSSDRHNAIQI
jgi:hypothetical protein